MRTEQSAKSQPSSPNEDKQSSASPDRDPQYPNLPPFKERAETGTRLAVEFLNRRARENPDYEVPY